MRYPLAVFDFDGTLADSFGWFIAVLDGVADRFGFRRVGREEVPALRRLDARQVLAHLGVPRWKLPLVAAHMRRLQADATIAVFPDVPPLIDDLDRAGVTLALVTSNSAANVTRVLGAPLIRRFAAIECGAGVFGKAGRLKRVSRRVAIPPSQAIAIGDEVRDIDAAREAGMAAAAVGWGYADPSTLAAHHPDILAATPAALRAALLGGEG